MIGYAEIPESLQPFSDRIISHPFQSYVGYMSALASADIHIVPLVDDVFNACKSAIRYLEASLLGIPSVVAAVGDFTAVVSSHDIGLLARDTDDWFVKLRQLIDSASLRAKIGEAARTHVLTHYTTKSVIQSLDPFLHSLLQPPPAPRNERRLLVVNVHFAPSSYGGATVQAENMARVLVDNHGWTVLVLTTFHDPDVVPYASLRYRIDGLDVVAVCVPHAILSFEETFENPRFEAVFAEILQLFDPDAAHIHCVQTMGVGILRLLHTARVPFAVTMHDCWWLCERQFMLDSSGAYCFQDIIDLNVCRYCVNEIDKTRVRQAKALAALDQATLLLYPSKFQHDLYVANGADPKKSIVNYNGVTPPAAGYRKRPIINPAVKLRFGFVGGPGPNKGAPQILSAFRSLQRTDYEFIVVDSLRNMGGSWEGYWDWSVPGTLTFLPGYTSGTMDEFFSSIDVLLFPSQWKESFGLTVREALMRDVWVIATDAGSVTENCTNGVNSTIIPMTPDYRPLRDAIVSVLDGPSLTHHINPEKSRLISTVQQARELSELLVGISKQ